MSDTSLNSLVRHLRRVAGDDSTGNLADAELLDRFLTTRDEAAFEVLVWRHGPMVLGTCRRVLHREQDVEDVFQATFLALVRKGRGIGRREAVGGWLYRVAYHAALRARAQAARRAELEAALPADRSSILPDDLRTRELRAVLDDAINQLPARYRAPLVLHYFQGKSLEEIGRELRVPPATVGTWLARGRDRLRGRLTRRGLAVTGSALIAALAVGNTNAAVSASLAGRMIALLSRSLVRSAAPGFSGRVSALADAALQASSVSRAKWALASLLAVCLLGLAGEQLLCPAQADEKGNAVTVAGTQPVVLRWRFEKNKPFYQTLETTTQQSIHMQGNDARQVQNQLLYWRWTPVTDPAAPGDLTLKQKVEGVVVGLDMGGNRITYDSTQENTANNPLADFYKALVGTEFTVVLGPDRQVKGAEGVADLAGKLAASNKALAPLARNLLSNTSLRYSAQLGLVSCPSGGVRPGDSWVQRTSVVLANSGRTFDLTWRYTYQGMEGNLDKITIDGIVSSGPVASGKEEEELFPNKLFTATRCEIRRQKVDGVLLFDRARGYAVRQVLHLHLEADMDLGTGNELKDVGVQWDQTTVTETSDAPQLGKGEGEVERLKRENERLRQQLQAIEEVIRRGKEGAEKK